MTDKRVEAEFIVLMVLAVLKHGIVGFLSLMNSWSGGTTIPTEEHFKELKYILEAETYFD